MFEKIKKWFTQGLWNETMVLNAYKKGVITNGQCNEILESQKV